MNLVSSPYSLDQEIPEASLPPGWVMRPVAGRSEAGPCVEAHRDAFHPSRLTVEDYLRLMDTVGCATWLYSHVCCPGQGFQPGLSAPGGRTWTRQS